MAPGKRKKIEIFFIVLSNQKLNYEIDRPVKLATMIKIPKY
jgi:hypothetical protein